MLKSNQDILSEIDATLDQLIANAEALKNLPIQCEYQMEISAFQNTQESLLAHLMHMDALLEEKKNKQISSSSFENLETKFSEFGKINASLLEKMAHRTVSKQKCRRGTTSKKSAKNIKIKTNKALV